MLWGPNLAVAQKILDFSRTADDVVKARAGFTYLAHWYQQSKEEACVFHQLQVVNHVQYAASPVLKILPPHVRRICCLDMPDESPTKDRVVLLEADLADVVDAFEAWKMEVLSGRTEQAASKDVRQATAARRSKETLRQPRASCLVHRRYFSVDVRIGLAPGGCVSFLRTFRLCY